MRSGAVHHLRDHPVCNMACGPKETVYPSYDSGMLSDETVNQLDLRYDWIRTEKQNSSELAEPSTHSMFRSYQKDETESDATQVVDLQPENRDSVAKATQETELYATHIVGSQPEVRSCGAQATQEAKFKLNPFVMNGNAPALPELPPKDILPKPLSLDKIMTLLAPRSNISWNHNFIKTDFSSSTY